MERKNLTVEEWETQVGRQVRSARVARGPRPGAPRRPRQRVSGDALESGAGQGVDRQDAHQPWPRARTDGLAGATRAATSPCRRCRCCEPNSASRAPVRVRYRGASSAPDRCRTKRSTSSRSDVGALGWARSPSIRARGSTCSSTTSGGLTPGCSSHRRRCRSAVGRRGSSFPTLRRSHITVFRR